MEPSEIYSILNRLDSSIPNYTTPKHYQNLRKQFCSVKSLAKNRYRKTFINNIEKLSKQIPASNSYFQTPNPKKEKNKSKAVSHHNKIDFNALMLKGTPTFIDSEIKQKKWVPGVGKYNPEVDKSQQSKIIYKIRNDKLRKQAPLFRPTAADQNSQIDSLHTGPGFYKQYQPIKFGNTALKFSISPEPKHKSKSLPKLPSPFSYRPIAFDTFEMKAALSKQTDKNKNNKCYFAQRNSLRSLDVSPGPKYSLISTWSKDIRSKTNITRNYFKSVASIPSKSIYRS